MDCSSVSTAPMAMFLVGGMEAPIRGARKAEENMAFAKDWSNPGQQARYSSARRRPSDAASRISPVCRARSFLGARSLFNSHASVSNIRAAGGRRRTRLPARDEKAGDPRSPAHRRHQQIDLAMKTTGPTILPRRPLEGAAIRANNAMRSFDYAIFASLRQDLMGAIVKRCDSRPPTLTGFVGASIRKLNDAGSFPIN